MISSLAWVRKGAAKEQPTRASMTDEEYERIAEHLGKQLHIAQQDLQEAQEQEQQDENDMVDENRMEEDNQPTQEPATKDANDLSVYNLDDYDKEDETADLETGRNDLYCECIQFWGVFIVPSIGVSLFSNIKGLSFYPSNEEDPYVQVGDDVDEQEELEEMQVAPTDHMLLAAKTEDDISHLEVYVYEGEEDNLYVHHDILLPSFPLCLEWLDFGVGSKSDPTVPGTFAVFKFMSGGMYLLWVL
jgi:periodic tryptophan protein 1